MIGDHSETWTGAAGNITNTAGTKNASLLHAAPGYQAGHGFEPVVRPTVTGMSFVSSPLGPDAYWVGETIEVAVDFSEPVIVTTGVRASLEVGTETRTMHYLRGTETGVVPASGFEVEDAVFGYVVVAADADDDGVDVPANALARQGDPSRGQLGPFWIHLEDGLGRLRLDTAAAAGGTGHAVDGSYRADADARLGSLRIGSPALVLPFDPDVTAYAADAGDEGIVTVTAEPVFASAAFGIAPLDARVGTAGHQVALAPGANTVEVTVTSTDGSVTSTYTVDVTRTGRALVSNHGRTLRNSPAQRSAQPFTTGGHAGGYVLCAVQVRLGNPVPSAGDALVRIFSRSMQRQAQNEVPMAVQAHGARGRCRTAVKDDALTADSGIAGDKRRNGANPEPRAPGGGSGVDAGRCETPNHSSHCNVKGEGYG